MRTGPPGLTEYTHCLHHWPIATIYARDCLDYTRPCSWLCFGRDVNPTLIDPKHPTLSSNHTQSMILDRLCLIQCNTVMVPFSGWASFKWKVGIINGIKWKTMERGEFHGKHVFPKSQKYILVGGHLEALTVCKLKIQAILTLFVGFLDHQNPQKVV